MIKERGCGEKGRQKKLEKEEDGKKRNRKYVGKGRERKKKEQTVETGEENGAQREKI